MGESCGGTLLYSCSRRPGASCTWSRSVKSQASRTPKHGSTRDRRSWAIPRTRSLPRPVQNAVSGESRPDGPVTGDEVGKMTPASTPEPGNNLLDQAGYRLDHAPRAVRRAESPALGEPKAASCSGRQVVHSTRTNPCSSGPRRRQRSNSRRRVGPIRHHTVAHRSHFRQGIPVIRPRVYEKRVPCRPVCTSSWTRSSMKPSAAPAPRLRLHPLGFRPWPIPAGQGRSGLDFTYRAAR